MPNRRRRKLSTVINAVAALAVASPCAYFLVYESTTGAKPIPEHHEFKQAAAIADLSGEVMSALFQGLSQFGINMPSVPALTGTGDAGNGLSTPNSINPGLGTPRLTAPDLNPGADDTYPILCDPSTLGGLSPTSPSGIGNNSTGGGGIVDDVMQVANQLGTNQVMDLIKDVLMPAIAQGVQNSNAANNVSSAVTPPATSLVPVT
ncbi:hypothetical protein MUBE_00540 [Mycobacterium uberis]|uniref:Exported repetitive protein n=1 Tax=Mycobacterium uberis TaxID=2162698 RepID=A0A3E1HLQ1_9MYCO|nr:hypothetical protein [Mycobacterium uberis]RFD27164.1 hypothetical protein MUBE_00540 [Mycobacterium uberis]